MTNVLDLQSISTTGSVGFLLVFATVNAVGYRLYDKVGGNRTIPLTGFVLCVIALAILIGHQYGSNATGVCIAISVVSSCFLMEWIYKRTEPRRNS